MQIPSRVEETCRVLCRIQYLMQQSELNEIADNTVGGCAAPAQVVHGMYSTLEYCTFLLYGTYS